MAALSKTRKFLFVMSHTALILAMRFGFFTAGISGGSACNTYPLVGDKLFLTKNHFQRDIPMWKNFTENKLVVQVTHRTLATLMIIGVGAHTMVLMKLPLPSLTKASLAILLSTLLGQGFLGMSSVWNSVPLETASKH